MNALPESVCELIARQFVADHLPQFEVWLQAHGVPAGQAGERALGLAMQTAATVASTLPDDAVDQSGVSADSTTARTSPRIPL